VRPAPGRQSEHDAEQVRILGRCWRKQRPDFILKQNALPDQISGMDAIMADATTCQFLPAPLTAEQLKTLIGLQEPIRSTGAHAVVIAIAPLCVPRQITAAILLLFHRVCARPRTGRDKSKKRDVDLGIDHDRDYRALQGACSTSR
jgi:hypothetical protein